MKPGLETGHAPARSAKAGLALLQLREKQDFQLAQAKATLSSDFGPNRSEERATIRPPSAR
jgi:hypothetical protein